ncbi:MAG: hypothetical protein FWC42_11040 [Proteobacteria bacterium]|nr:hypothetical protein [Pseudomonadota bacterium]
MLMDSHEIETLRSAQEQSDRFAFADAVLARKIEMVNDYVRSATHLPMSAELDWAPSVPDYSAPKVAETGQYLRRYPTLGEVLVESLEHTNGPSQSDLFDLLAAAARGEPVKERAASLIARMAGVWVDWRDDEVAEMVEGADA